MPDSSYPIKCFVEKMRKKLFVWLQQSHKLLAFSFKDDSTIFLLFFNDILVLMDIFKDSLQASFSQPCDFATFCSPQIFHNQFLILHTAQIRQFFESLQTTGLHSYQNFELSFLLSFFENSIITVVLLQAYVQNGGNILIRSDFIGTTGSNDSAVLLRRLAACRMVTNTSKQLIFRIFVAHSAHCLHTPAIQQKKLSSMQLHRLKNEPAVFKN